MVVRMSIAGLVNSNRFYSMQYRPVIYTNWAHVPSFTPNTFALTSPVGYFGVPPTGLPTEASEESPPPN
jgi:hypothetical protein